MVYLSSITKNITMLLIASALALLAIYAGMKLLALTKKEGLGNGFKYISWFIVIMSFLILICVGAHCLMHCCLRGEHNMMRTEMRDGNWGNRHMGEMYRHDGMMRDGGCCGGMKDGACGDGMGSCNGAMQDNSCKMGGNMKGCTMEKKDSVVVKKK
jgi:hypothetical protein